VAVVAVTFVVVAGKYFIYFDSSLCFFSFSFTAPFLSLNQTDRFNVSNFLFLFCILFLFCSGGGGRPFSARPTSD
jgi:hypothetical protein